MADLQKKDAPELGSSWMVSTSLFVLWADHKACSKEPCGESLKLELFILGDYMALFSFIAWWIVYQDKTFKLVKDKFRLELLSLIDWIHKQGCCCCFQHGEFSDLLSLPCTLQWYSQKQFLGCSSPKCPASLLAVQYLKPQWNASVKAASSTRRLSCNH